MSEVVKTPEVRFSRDRAQISKSHQLLRISDIITPSNRDRLAQLGRLAQLTQLYVGFVYNVSIDIILKVPTEFDPNQWCSFFRYYLVYHYMKLGTDRPFDVRAIN